jgi:hypothetical protein
MDWERTLFGLLTLRTVLCFTTCLMYLAGLAFRFNYRRELNMFDMVLQQA